MRATPSLERTDLNLVRVFVAIYEMNSVSRAADRLSLAQPSVSYSLGRLREIFGDPLFTRTSHGMLATPFSETLYPSFAEALAIIDSTVENAQKFDPAKTTRVFKVAMSDLGTSYFLPQLLKLLREEAPLASIEVEQVAIGDIADALATGRIDAAVGNLPVAKGATRSSLLFRERYVCLIGKDHPWIRSKLTFAEFARARHVFVASPFSGHEIIESVFRERGVDRVIALRIPYFSSIPYLLPGSDLVVTLPSRVADTFESWGEMRSVNLPVKIPQFDVRVHWHARHTTNAAVRWLCSRIEQVIV